MFRMGVMRAFASLVCATLFGTVLFAAAVAVSEPAAGAIQTRDTLTNTAFAVPAGGSNTFNMRNYIYDDTAGVTFTCADITVPSTNAYVSTITRDDCSYTVTFKATAPSGGTDFNVNVTPSSGTATNVSVRFNRGPASAITFTGPTGLVVATNRRRVIDALDYVTEAHPSYTISCGDATSIDTTELMSVTRISSGNGCMFNIDPKNVQGAASFTVPYTSSAGDTENGVVNIQVGPGSSVAIRNYNETDTFVVPSNGRNTINFKDYIYDTRGYPFTCTDLQLAFYTNPARNVPDSDCTFTFRNSCTSFCTAAITNIPILVPYRTRRIENVSDIWIRFAGPASNITFTAPTGLSVAPGSTLEINAASYASETSPSYKISCGDATSIDTTEIDSVTREGCTYTVTAKNVTGASSFTVPYTSSAGNSHSSVSTQNGVIGLQVTNLDFTAPTPNPFVPVSTTRTIDLSPYASDGANTITCGTATESSALISLGTQSGCSLPVTAGATTGTAEITVPYTSSGGGSLTATLSIDVTPASDITFTAPTGLQIGTNRTRTINALDYVTDTHTSYTITCGDATSIDTTELMSVTRSGCMFTVTPTATQGSASFTVPYTSTGGDTTNGVINIEVGPASTITFTPPASNPAIPASRTRTIDVSTYAADGTYTITCGTITTADADITLGTQTGCSIPITAGSSSGQTADISIPYTSAGGHTLTSTLTIDIGAASSITFNAPTGLQVGINRTQTIDASAYASDGSYTITCGDATSIDSTRLTSVTRTANTCSFTISPITTLTQSQQGSASFTVPYTSSGGDTQNGVISIEVGPASTIVFTAPASNPAIPASGTSTIDVSSYAADGTYAITCGTITESDADITLGTQTGCSIPITAGSTSGQTADISIPYTSAGGHTITSTLTIDIGAASSITFNAPTGLQVGTNRTLTIDASDYASDGGYTITCGTATNTAANMPTTGTVALMSVTRTANTCTYTITPTSAQGTATFTVPYTSNGGDTANGNISVTVGPASTIVFTAPAANPAIAASRTRTIDVSTYAADGTYTITCGTITESDPDITLGTQTGCSIEITAGSTPGQTADISIPYTSAGGHTLTSTLTIDIGAASNIAFNAPAGLQVGTNRTLTIDASDYATDGNYTITCEDATNTAANVPTSGTVALMSVTRTANTCSYTITPTSAQGLASFTVPYTSSGGDTQNGLISIEVGPASTIVFTAPASNPAIPASGTRTIDVSSYAADGTYAITCGTITTTDTNITLGTQTGCSIEITAGSTPSQTADITIPYTSAGSHTLTSTLTIDIGAASSITFNAPTGLQVGINYTQTIDASDYASDGSYTITCGDATSIDTTEIRSVVRDGCMFTVSPKNVQGAASFTVPYTSASGNTLNGVINIEVGPPSAVTYTAPTGLEVAVNRHRVIDASEYAADAYSGYTISCGDATNIDTTELNAVTRSSSGNGCMFTVAPKNVQGAASFTVPFISSGGATTTGVVPIAVGPGSSIAIRNYNQNNSFVVPANGSNTINFRDYVYDTRGYPFTCVGLVLAGFTNPSETRPNDCTYTFTNACTQFCSAAVANFPVRTSAGTIENIRDVWYRFAGPASNITFTAPTGLQVGRGSTIEINAASYATEASPSYKISCGDATSIDTTEIDSVTREGCVFTVTAKNVAGASSFTVPYTSTAGDTENGIIALQVTAITFTAPTPNPFVPVSSTRTIDLSAYASDGANTITCGTVTESSALISLGTQNGCSLPVTATATTGTAEITVPYTSSGGTSVTATLSVDVTPASDITFTAPTGLQLGTNRTQTIDASDYVTETHSSYTITCGDATSIDTTELMSVSRDGCMFTVTPTATQGSASFTVPYTSSGGDTENGVINITVGPASTITFTPPASNPAIAITKILTLDVSSYATEAHSGYAISCGTITTADTDITLGTQTGCSIPITAGSTPSQTADISIPYTSAGGHAITSTLTIDIVAASFIAFNAPTGLQVGTNRTQTIDASNYASDGSYTITCGDATSIDTTELMSVSRSGCMFTVTPKNVQGAASFTVPYTSSGGTTIDGVINIEVGPPSSITYNAPTGLEVAVNRHRVIDASEYATDAHSGYTIRCGDATNIDTTELNTVTRSSRGNGCIFTIAPKNIQGAASFTVPYISSGGATTTGVVPITVGPGSSVAIRNYNQNNSFVIPRTGSNTINFRDYVYDTRGYPFTCTDLLLSGFSNPARNAPSDCTYTITNGCTQFCSAIIINFPVQVSSGAIENIGDIWIRFAGPASNITFTAPTGLQVGRNGTLEINAASYATEASPSYKIYCGDAINIDAAEIQSVTREGCIFTVTPKNVPGASSFTVPYTSTAGDTENGVIGLQVTNITFTAPTPNPFIVVNSSGTIDLSTYASDGSNTITCGTVTESSALLSITSQNGCSVVLAAGSSTGTAQITVPYTSSGGTSLTATLSVDISPASNITFTGPTGLQVGTNRTRVIDALDYVTEVNDAFTITCGNATSIDTTRLASVVRDSSGNGCSFTITPISTLTPAQQGAASFTVPYTSSGGATENGVINITVGPPSTINYNPPSGLTVASNLTLTLDASDYVSDGSYTITCGTATNTAANVPTTGTVALTSVARDTSGNGCSYTITPTSATGTAIFTVPYTSAGGHTRSGNISMQIGPASNIVYNAPSGLTVGRNRTLVIDALDAISGENAAYTVSCGDATGVDANRMTVTRSSSGDGCSFTVDPVDTLAVGSQGNTTFAVAFTSTGGATASGTFTVNIGPDSTITYNAPTGLEIGRNLTLSIDASDYVSEAGSSYTISCSDARNLTGGRLTSVARTANTCSYTIDPNNSASTGTASFTITYTSSGGHSIVRVISLRVGPNSVITLSTPPTSGANRLLTGRNRALVVDAGSYASETSGSGWTITCGDATSIDSTRLVSVTHTGSSCSFTVTPISTLSSSRQATNATFTVPYTSTGGATANGIIAVKIGPDSTITYNAPTLTRGSNLRTFTIDASDYVAETTGSGYTISCGTATSVDTTEITSVTRLSNSCRYRIVLNGTQGTTGFTVPYTSTGGHAISRAVQITVGPASSIVFSAPASNPAVAASRTLTLDVGSYAADGSYTITCGTITEFSALISLGSQTQGSCSIPITAGTSTGAATISVPYISSGGATLTRSITIDVGGASNISFTAPSNLKVGINRTQTINALDYASDSGYTITCGTATSIDTTRLTSVARDSSGNGCGYTITPISTLTQSQQGAASFTVPLTSDGGDSENAVFSIAVGPASTITFTAPSALLVPKNRTLTVDVAPYAVEANPSNYAISCGDATSIDTVELQSVTHTGSSCSFTITPKNVAGSASFTVPYTSEGGHSVDGAIPVTVGPDSTITYTSPGTLTVGRNRTLTIDASGYVEEIASSGHTITCSDASGVDNTRLTSVTRTANTCSFTITPVSSLASGLQGDTTFSITFTSSGGHEITRTITVNVGTDSTIVFTPPASNPAIAANRTRTLDVSSYAADGSYTISCGAITESSNLISLGTQDGCNIPVTAMSTQGTADITIPYRSTGGHTLSSTLTLDVGAASSIVFNAPTGLAVGTNRTQTINALDYATDGGYTITCGTATNTGANVPTTGTVALTSVVRDTSGNGCGYTIRPTSAQGTATFTIPYTSAGGDTANGNISITVGPASTIVYSSPGTLRVGRNQTLEIDASGYASDGSYAITCADATGVDNTKLTSVSRTANTCDFTIDPVDALAPANQGTTTFSIAFTSAGGHSITRSVAVNIGPNSNLVFTAPSTFTLGRNRTLVIDALAAISGENAAYTVSCADATGVDANKMTVTRSSSGSRCSFTVDPVDTLVVGSQGDATFAVAFASTGGATASGTFTVNIGPDSTITANIPPATGAGRLQVARNLTLEIDASDYVSEASNTYTISCSDARSIHSRLTSVARTANTCRYTIDPNNFAFPGAATFVVTFTSTGGHSIDRTITVNVGANSVITFTPPPTSGANRLLVGRNRALVVDVSAYARETSGSGYTISCGDATGIDSTRLASVTHSGSSCSFTVTPVSSLSSSLQATNATFTVPYSSSGGATANGTISVKVGPDSTITYNAPTLERGNNLRTFTIDAADYVSETSGSGYTISCGTATSVDTTEITSVTRLSNSCRYRIVLNGTQGTTGFTVPYTSTGGHAISRAVQITVGAASSIVFSAPASNPAVAASRTLTLDVSSYAADGSYTISCGTITEFSALISLGAQTGCSIPITAATSTGTAFISVPYISSGGATTTRSISIDVGVASNIQFTAPSNLKVGINRTQTINALDYATDSGYTITCGTATSIDTTKLTSVARDSSGNGCGYTITPISTLTQSQQGSASFTVPLTSDGGDTENAVFSITVGPASTITFTPPSPALSVAKNRTITVDVSGYAVEANPTNYAISCGDATSIDTVELQSVTHTGRSCTFTINPKNVAGSASFTVPYTSEGGHSVSGAISVTVGPDSNIVYTPPTGLRVARNRTLEIDATDHFTESSTYTVTCGDATGIDNTRLTSVARTANTCTFTVDPVDTLAAGLQGNTTFTVPLSSTGGHARNALFTVNVGPDSNIVFAAPTGLKVGRNRTLAINALAAVTENPAYTVTCADATGVSANRMTVTRSSTGSRCVFTVDPVDTLATGLQGNTTFAVAFTSTGGATASGTFTVNIGPDSTITYNAPTGLLVGRNRTLTIDASGYVSEADSNNTITCGDATAIHSRLTSVARTANSCSYTIDPNNFATVGTATFAIAFTSDGGHSRTETISVEVGPDSNIRFTAPPTSGPNRLRIGRNLTLSIDALDYVNENAAYTVTCGDATGVDAARLTVTHTGSSCDFTIDPVDTLAQSLQGNTSFTIPYTSDGGATATGRITVNIGPDSAITFTAPTGLKIGRNRTLVIDALAAVSGENAAYTVSCADATGVDANRMTVTRSSSGNRCSFTVDPVDTLAVGSQGDTTFSVAFSSTGGATASGTFTVNIGPDSAIVYTAPAGLQVGRNRTLSVDLSSAATDGSYTVSCGDATNIHPRFSSVTRPDAQASPCVFAAAPRTTASLGTATFRVPFTSDGGATSAGTVSIAISQPSTIVFTAPDPALKIGINRTRTIDALDYARDGNYTITCLDATGVDSTKLTSVTRSSAGNGCGYTINPISSLTQSQQGDATFTVPYRSAGGHVLNQEFTIGVGPASTIVYTAPVGANALTVGHNRALTIDASSYAADGSYAISCGDARSIHARIDHITRQGCSFTITPVSGMTGAATFTVPYSSAGGHTRDGQVSVTIGAASNIVYSAPSGIVIPVSTARTIDVGSYASDGSYAISCGDATGVNASRLASVTHTGSSCSFEITAAANQGSTSFVVPYRSAGGATLSGTISLSVGPASSIVFTAPSGLDVHVGETLLVHANDYASDGPYSLQCADATNRSASLTSVVRTANTCDFTITPGSSTGTGTFNVPYTSSGGATHTGTISVNISPQSTITFTAPTGLSVAAGRSVTVDASTAADTVYTVSCGDATAVNPRIASVSRTGCSYAVRAGSIAGSASFTIPFTSTGGATLNAQIAITIGPRSSIAFAAPAGLSVQIGSTLTIDASDYAADSAYTITCQDATGVPSVFASVARTANTCSFVITPGASTGTGSFTVPYASSGGATRNGSITVAVTPESSIVFAPPPISGPDRLRIGAGNTRTINLASYATDGPYSITCGNATATEPAKLTDIHRNACRYTITAAATAAQGNTTFSLTYTSSGGNTNNASFTINIGPASDIVYTAPADITLQAGSAQGIDLSSYATDGTGNDAYTIGCLDATDIDPEISSVTRNGCVYTIRAGSTPGEADFHITYTSTGGDTHLATVHITITPAPARPTEPTERPIIPPQQPTARPPAQPPTTTTTTTTTADPSRPTTTLEPDQPGPRWNTLTAQSGGTTPGQIRQAFNLGSTQTIYTWNTARQTWTRATRSSQAIPAGTRVSFRTEEAVTNREMRTSNLGGGTTRMRLTSGWATLSIPQGITRTDGTNFLLDPSLTDCRNQQGVIAIASYSTRSRRWSISLPCHPTAQRRLTTGQNAPYRPLMSIAPADTTYIYTRTRQPLNIRWNDDTQTYQVFQSIFTR